MRKGFFLIILLISIKLASAQNTVTKAITASFQNTAIDQFVTELELKSAYHFYYNPAQFDSVKINLSVIDKSIDEVLQLAFKNTIYHYAIDPVQLRIFLTKGVDINGQLAAARFRNEPDNPNTEAENTVPTDVVTGPVIEATKENKIYEIGIKTNSLKAGDVILSGYVKDKSGHPIPGAAIKITNPANTVTTDKEGFYSFSLKRGMYVLTIRALGMFNARRQVILYSGGELNILMFEQLISLKQVDISADKLANVKSVEMGVSRLDIKSIKQVPAVFGEADILRVVLTLPGVQSVGESTTGFNVRGGSADQNLILLNNSTIYNPAHFFGFFSAFNPDIVKDIELYKSTIPEKYGGRLSSVLQVTDRDGDKKVFTGSAGIGLLTSRLNIEGPIIKDKTSFIFGARTSYSDWLLGLLPEAYKHSEASFYDINLDIAHQVNANNSIYIYSYISHDGFKLNSDTAYSYGNKNVSIKWKHNFNNHFLSAFSTGYDRYQYQISSDANPVNGYNLDYNVNQSNFKADFTYTTVKHTIGFGLSSVYYRLHSGDFEPFNDKSLAAPNVVPAEQALESALYLGDKYDISSKLTVNLGVRYSLYDYLGPRTVDYYTPNLPKEDLNIADSITYKKNKVINNYHGPEIRASARYSINDNLSIKASYNTLRQFIHLLSNTTAISPTDVYKLSDPNIKPQYGSQVSLGLYKNIKENSIETSVEVYYKTIRHYLDYKDGATLLLNPHIEQDVINTQGKAYGAEFLVKKTSGKLNGWVSYTYSRTFLRQDDPYAGQLINKGNYYPSNYDKPNDFNFTGNYRFSHRYSMSLNVVYSTGRPITLPVAEYFYLGSQRVYYTDRNAYRVPDYFRTDFSVNIEGNHKVHQRTHNSWTVGVYNLTGRANSYSTYFSEQGGFINGYQLSIFARPIPFVNYNIRF